MPRRAGLHVHQLSRRALRDLRAPRPSSGYDRLRLLRARLQVLQRGRRDPRGPRHRGVHPSSHRPFLTGPFAGRRARLAVEILGAEETAARLPYADLAESIKEIALERKSGDVQVPARTALPLPEEGVLLVMPASGGGLAI